MDCLRTFFGVISLMQDTTELGWDTEVNDDILYHQQGPHDDDDDDDDDDNDDDEKFVVVHLVLLLLWFIHFYSRMKKSTWSSHDYEYDGAITVSQSKNSGIKGRQGDAQPRAAIALHKSVFFLGSLLYDHDPSDIMAWYHVDDDHPFKKVYKYDNDFSADAEVVNCLAFACSLCFDSTNISNKLCDTTSHALRGSYDTAIPSVSPAFLGFPMSLEDSDRSALHFFMCCFSIILSAMPLNGLMLVNMRLQPR
jgi:hypothetical protein